MLELHDKPNDPWYARQNADGTIELNADVPDAEALLEKHHPTLAAALRLERKRRKALRVVRKLVRKLRPKGNAADRAEIDAVISEINAAEPDVAE